MATGVGHGYPKYKERGRRRRKPQRKGKEVITVDASALLPALLNDVIVIMTSRVIMCTDSQTARKSDLLISTNVHYVHLDGGEKKTRRRC